MQKPSTFSVLAAMAAMLDRDDIFFIPRFVSLVREKKKPNLKRNKQKAERKARKIARRIP